MNHRKTCGRLIGAMDRTPVPESSSLTLLGAGLLCCVGFGLVRRKSPALDQPGIS